MHIWTSHDVSWLEYEVFPHILNGSLGGNEADMEHYFDSSEYIDWNHPLVLAKAAELAEAVFR